MTRRKTCGLALAGALLVVVAVHFLTFPGSVPNFTAVSNGGVLLDASPAFSVDALYERLTNYGEEGRRNYWFRNMTVDVLLPLSMLPFFVLLMRMAVEPLASSRLRAALMLLPVAYVLFDLMENAAVLILLSNYPERMQLLPAVLPYVTIVKRAASILALLTPLAILAFFVAEKAQGIFAAPVIWPPAARTLAQFTT